ncbi:MAG: Yip1 family protein [Alphaproteobacteria bacterium]|nr:Yip1 family protein [Alphaproteobacteria bacterium]
MVNLIARVKNLLLSPRTEWIVIHGEKVEPKRLIAAYVAPLAALPAVATVIGLSVVGIDVAGERYRAPILGVLASAVLFFVLAIAGVVVFAALINRLAPVFGAGRDYRQALKLSAYSITAAMLAGAVTIVPALGVIALMGMTYSLYLLFLGVPTLMKPPQENAANYSIVATACAVGLSLAVGLAAMLTATASGGMFPQMAALPELGLSEAVHSPGANQAGESQVVAATGLTQDRPAPGLSSAGALKAAVPRRLAGLKRVAVGVEASGTGDARALTLGAEYRSGQRFIVIEIVNSPTLASVVGFGGPATSEFDRETAEGYSRRRRVGAEIIVEEWNEASETGSYGRILADTYYVKASGGGGIRPADLKQAVEHFTVAKFGPADTGD